MRILLVNTFYYPNMHGGAEHSVKLLAENMHKQGNDVRVFTIDADREKANPLHIDEINNVIVYRRYDNLFDAKKHFNASNKREKILCRLTSIRNRDIRKDLDYIMEKFNPEVVHVNNVYGISSYIWEYFHKRNVKVIFTIRDYFLYDPKARVGGTSGILLAFYQAFFRYQSNKYVDVVTAPSEYTLDVFCKKGYFKNSKRQCVVNSIIYNKKRIEELVSDKKNRTDKLIEYIFVGALTHDKGIDNLIDAFSTLRLDNIKLSICGSGPLKEEVLKAEGEDSRITYKGQLDEQSMAEAYAKADVLIAPSTWDEPFGRIIIEGNQYGLAVIGSNRAGIAETLQYMKSGEVVNPDSVNDIAASIRRFSDRGYFRKYLENIPERLDRYSINFQVDAFMKLYI